MRMLFLEPRMIYPLDTGGKIRSFNILKKLTQQHDITVVCYINNSEEDVYLPQMETCCTTLVTVPWKESKKDNMLFYAGLFLNLFSKYAYMVKKYYSNRMRRVIQKLLDENQFDVVVCDFLHTSINLPDVDQCPTILFQHNIESEIRKRHYMSEKNFLKKWYMYLQWKKLYKFEEEICKRFDHCIVVSEHDREVLQKEFGLTNVSIIPTGVDTEYYRVQQGKERANSLIFTGSMDWIGNEDSILYFVREIFPHIKVKVPDVNFSIVGRNPSQKLKQVLKFDTSITLTGRVPDIRPYIANSQVYIVPLVYGGGTRIKIFEAMAMGKPVVSTTIGAEGLPVTPEENIIIADEPEEFASRIVQLFNDANLRKRLGTASRKIVEENFTWDKVAEHFSKICKKIIAEKKR